ncbi:MAG: hypothetical protein WC790_03000 [Candidatus Paceibacterota bacterium]|jgi:hypothetical protein
MKFPDSYTIGRHLQTFAAYLVAVLSWGVFTAMFAITSYYSDENKLRLNNAQAAEKFVYTVETDFPRNRVSVLYALHDMRSAYEETGENDPARLGQLARLEDWLVRSHTAGEEQLFLTEVRSHGEVAAQTLWFGSWYRIVLSILAGFYIGFGILKAINALLGRMDPRLRPSRAAGC